MDTRLEKRATKALRHKELLSLGYKVLPILKNIFTTIIILPLEIVLQVLVVAK
jgi:hypothetical protein